MADGEEEGGVRGWALGWGEGGDGRADGGWLDGGGAAAEAGAEAGGFGGSGGEVVNHVGFLGRGGGADGTAVDPRGAHGDKEAAVEAGVTGAAGRLAKLRIEGHFP